MKDDKKIQKSGAVLLLILSLLSIFWLPVKAGSSYSKEDMERTLAIFAEQDMAKDADAFAGQDISYDNAWLTNPAAEQCRQE